MQVFENKTLGTEVDEVSGKQIIIYSEKLRELCCYSHYGEIKEVEMDATFRRNIMSPSSGTKSKRL
jgi:hypothetical protein